MEEKKAFDQLRKELLATRIFCCITALLMVALLVGGFLIWKEAKGYLDMAMPLVSQMSDVDFAALNGTLEHLDETLTSIDWERFSQQVEDLDMTALNEAMEGLDTVELTKALERLNEVADKLENAGDSVKEFLTKFGGLSSLFGGLQTGSH